MDLISLIEDILLTRRRRYSNLGVITRKVNERAPKRWTDDEIRDALKTVQPPILRLHRNSGWRYVHASRLTMPPAPKSAKPVRPCRLAPEEIDARKAISRAHREALRQKHLAFWEDWVHRVLVNQGTMPYPKYTGNPRRGWIGALHRLVKRSEVTLFPSPDNDETLHVCIGQPPRPRTIRSYLRDVPEEHRESTRRAMDLLRRPIEIDEIRSFIQRLETNTDSLKNAIYELEAGVVRLKTESDRRRNLTS